MKLPKSLTKKMYTYARRKPMARPGEDPYIIIAMADDFRNIKGDHGLIFLSECEVEVPLPEGELDLVTLEIKAAEKMRDEILGEAQAKATAIDAHIQNLLAIGHDG